MPQDSRPRRSEVVGAASLCCPLTDRSARVALGLTHHGLSLDLYPTLQCLKDIVVLGLHSSTSLMHVGKLKLTEKDSSHEIINP